MYVFNVTNESWTNETFVKVSVHNDNELEDLLNFVRHNGYDTTPKQVLKVGRGGYKLYNNGFNVPIAINKIYFNKAKKVTTVLWSDDVKTIVKLHKGEKWSKETAVAYAIAKRYSGSGRSFNKLIEEKSIDIVKKERKNEKKKK